MEYKYFTLGTAPKVGKDIVVNGRHANVRFVSDKRIFIRRSLILRQPELAIYKGLAAIRVGFEFIE
ncbi:hypothetical protein [Psychrobacter glacincola]|uniref:hypothetical protein n=1 Tax=Psychrobacter glacincola TaxID=56810 RepID=UPI0039AFA0EC